MPDTRTPNEDANLVRNRLNHQHLNDAAAYTAAALTNGGAARIELTPGDATLYQIGIFAAGGPVWRDGFVVAAREALIVVTGFGTILWSSDHDVHWSYVADKLDGRMATGVVVAEFLNRVVELMNA